MTDAEAEFIASGVRPFAGIPIIRNPYVPDGKIAVVSSSYLPAIVDQTPFFKCLTPRRPHNIFPMMEVVPYGKTLDRLPQLPRLARSYVWKLRHRLADRLERIADAIGG